MRLSRDAGQSYPQRFERNLTPGLPGVPAAVRIYGKDGACAALFLDFDSSVAGLDWVEADVKSVQAWLYGHGARWIEDYSPNGGRHIYVPLAERVTFSDARALVMALGSKHRTLDKTPHLNLLHGCMRTPGSRHKRGGYQVLAMSLSMAYDVARRPNTAQVWDALYKSLAPEIEQARTQQLALEELPTAPSSGPRDFESQRMSRAMTQIACHGLYDVNRYASDSEARQAVITAAAAAGLEVLEVARRMKQGLWPGLASFYARYSPVSRSNALRRDWQKAQAFLAKKPDNETSNDHARKNPTSEHKSQGGSSLPNNYALANSPAEHQWIRTWRNSLSLVESRYTSSRVGLGRRMVLRALGQAAHMSGSRFIEFGDRSLAVATGMDHTTVGTHLRALRAESDPLVILVEAGRGTKGDLYQLNMPAEALKRAEKTPWRRGKLHALRPVFRELGMVAAFVFEALENSPTPLLTAEIVRATGLSRTAVSEALEILAAWNMVAREHAWSVVAGTSLLALAEYLGVMEAVAAQIHKYRCDRAIWHAWLAANVIVAPLLPSPTEDYPWETFEGPPEDQTLADWAYRAAG